MSLPVRRFKPHEDVRVRFAEGPGHVRTPWYVQGKVGWVEVAHGSFRNPEQRAYGRDGLPTIPLYTVGFRQTDVWAQYNGSPHDKVYVDIFEHWLEPASRGLMA
jgi:hypothetical protein